MRVIVNERYVQRKARLGRYASLAGLAILGLAILITVVLQQSRDLNPLAIAFSYLCLPFGFILSQIGNYNRLRWARPPEEREDGLIAQSLKGLDRDYRLLSYLPGLPAHVLLAPGGIYVIEPRYNSGKVSVHGDTYRGSFNWLSLFGGAAEGRLGNPAADAFRGAEQLRSILAQRLGDEAAALPIQPVVLFLSRTVKLEVVDPTVPTLTTRELKSFLRKSQPKQKLSPAEQRQVSAALVGELEPSLG